MHRRTCGLRFSFIDAVAIILCVAGAIWIWPVSQDLAIALPVVLGHFFLFCNVFRVRRKPELTWSACFLLNLAVWYCSGNFSWYYSGNFSWLRVLAVQTPITFELIRREMQKPWYHGIFSRRINAENIDAYLRGNIK